MWHLFCLKTEISNSDLKICERGKCQINGFIFRIFIVLNNKNKYSEKEKTKEKLEERQVKLRKIFIRRYVEVQESRLQINLNKLLVDPDRLLKNVFERKNYFICPIENQDCILTDINRKLGGNIKIDWNANNIVECHRSCDKIIL